MERVLCFLLSLALISALDVPIITHLSSPALPNETVLISGGPFAPDCLVRIETTSQEYNFSVDIPAIEGQSTIYGLAATIPENFPLDIYAVSVGRCAGSSVFSPKMLLNAPKPWWTQGDLGDKASLGGWIRVHGLALELGSQTDRFREHQLRLRTARNAVTQLRNKVGGRPTVLAILHIIIIIRPASIFNAACLIAREWTACCFCCTHYTDLWQVDSGEDDDSPLLLAIQQFLDARSALQQLQKTLARSVTLRLTPSGGGQPIDLAPVANFTTYGGIFKVPADLGAMYYNLSISNGFGGSPSSGGTFVALDTFVDPEHPHEVGIAVIRPPSWPPGVFVVTETSTPCILIKPDCRTSDQALQVALEAAHLAGGGTVFFPRGLYYFTSPIAVPTNTRLVGEETSLVSIFFSEYTQKNAPFALIFLNESHPDVQLPAAWGLSDLTIYVTAFHNSVLWVSNNTNGFTMRRVRARANAFMSLEDFGSSTRGRSANWTVLQNGHLIDLHARNFEIVDCDLLSTGHIINSQAFQCPRLLPGVCAGAQFGFVARNIFWNGGGGSHYMCLWQQVVFEQNVAHGASLFSHGQALDTGIGGYAQHVYNADNSIQLAWGGDREVMTYDTESGAYYGTLADIHGTTVTTSHDTVAAGYMKFNGWHGGALVVLNGSGAGQIRRIVVPGIDNKPTPTNRTWVLEQPFDILPDRTAMVQIMAYRGRAIFFRNFYADVGPFQFYTISLESVAAEIWAERFEGFVGFGQWRGWNFSSPQLDNNNAVIDDGPQSTGAGVSASAVHLDGELGIGMQPNFHTLYVDNRVLEGNTVVNFNSSQVQFDPLWYGMHKYVTIPISSSPTPPNLFIVYRRNSALSNGGVWIGRSAQHVLVEHFTATNSTTCVDVDNDTVAVFVRGTVCIPS